MQSEWHCKKHVQRYNNNVGLGISKSLRLMCSVRRAKKSTTLITLKMKAVYMGKMGIFFFLCVLVVYLCWKHQQFEKVFAWHMILHDTMFMRAVKWLLLLQCPQSGSFLHMSRFDYFNEREGKNCSGIYSRMKGWSCKRLFHAVIRSPVFCRNSHQWRKSASLTKGRGYDLHCLGLAWGMYKYT